MIHRGKLIVLEGLDRSGKSSVVSYLCEWLSQERKGKTVGMSFPDRTTPIGKMIDEFLRHHDCELSNEAVHLLFSANRWEKTKVMEDTLAAGTSIICDRYWYSGVAYSMAKGLQKEWCTWPDKGLLEPDLVIYLQATP
jgi:dTMP kinase